MRRAPVRVALAAAALATSAAPAAAQEVGTSDIAGGGSLPYTTPPRGYRPSVGITLRTRAPQLAVRFDTTVLCGRESIDVQARRTVTFNDATIPAPIAAQGSERLDLGGGRRLDYAWRVTGAMAPGQASGTLHITGTLHARRATTSCAAAPDRPWLVRASIPPSEPQGPPPPGATFFGSTSQDLGGGLPGGVIVRVTRDGRKVTARWTAVARCTHGPRELLVNVTPATTLRGAAFSRSERFTQRFTDALVRYRVRFDGRTAADGASGGLRLQARVFDRRGRRLRATCDSGAHGWNTTAIVGAPPALGTATTPPSPAPPQSPTGGAFPQAVHAIPGAWSLHLEGDVVDQPGVVAMLGDFGPANAPIEVTTVGGASMTVAVLRPPEVVATLELEAPPGRALIPGAYPDAHRAGFSGASPGLDVTIGSSGCNQLSGTFFIDAIAFDPNGALRTLVVRFSWLCENNRPERRGTFEFHAA